MIDTLIEVFKITRNEATLFFSIFELKKYSKEDNFLYLGKDKY